jgi:iron-sulfur cluster repair protein YtfE (RIC family)
MARSVVNEKLDAIDILQLDHLRVHGLFRSIWWSRNFDEQKKYYDLLRSELLSHAEIEEDIFYPAARAQGALRDVVDTSYEQHALMKHLITEIDAALKGNGQARAEFETKLEVLFQNVDRHVVQEERAVLPILRAVMSRRELISLGDKLERGREHRRGRARPSSRAA